MRCIVVLLGLLVMQSSVAEAFFVQSGRAPIETTAVLRRLSSGREKHPLPILKSKVWKQRFFVRGGQHQMSSTTPRQQQQQQDETLQKEQKEQSGRSWMSYLTARFVQLLFQGMTLPFPMLRELGGNVNGDNAQAMLGFSLRECLLAIFSYLCLGTISYSFLFEKWPLIDSLYFSVVTFTSVGYGDLTPTTTAGKMFTCLFGLSGLAFLGAAISTIGSSLIGKQEALLQKAEEASRKRIKDIFEGMPHVVKSLAVTDSTNGTATSVTATPAAPDTTDKHQDDNTTPIIGWRATAQKTGLSLVPALSFLLFGGMVMARIEGWKSIDSIYYSVITGSTIGFGDFFPKTCMGRAFGIFFIPLAVAAAGDVLGNVGSSLVERRQAKVFSEIMNRTLTMDSLLEMDTDHNGKVSREEYVRFMLTEMGVVEPEEYEELFAQFKRLDADNSGYLDKSDLYLVAKHRGAIKSSSTAS